MKRQVRIIVLYEGQRDRMFLNQYLRRRGYTLGKVHYKPCARDTGGSGEKRVSDQFAIELTELRRYTSANMSNTRWLLVHIDADMKTVDDRLGELSDQLPQQLTTDDPVCVLIPRRNTETWVYYLLNPASPVSETVDYKNQVSDDDVVEAGRMLAEFLKADNINAPPSLIRSVGELERIPR